MAVRTITYDTMGKKIQEELVPVEKDRALLLLARSITEMKIKHMYAHYTLEDGSNHVILIGDEERDVMKG